ncbi:hypothetical protein MPSEU_000042100 [Mayamaea pseudoterrestris]|nr:hypothetical protein MPSEU_000042100 [Mayamaea pseudoterrestris]
MERSGSSGDGKQPPPPVLGAIPRKKLPAPPPSSLSSASASSIPVAPPTPGSVEDARLRQFKKPKHKLSGRSLPMSTSSSQQHLPHDRDRQGSAQAPARHAQESKSSDSSSTLKHPRQRHKHKEPKTIRILSNDPIILKIRTHGMDLDSGYGIYSKHRASLRAPIKRASYVDDVNDDDLLMTETEDEDEVAPKKKRQRLVPFKQTQTSSAMDEAFATNEAAADGIVVTSKLNTIVADSPPPGVLNTLWYSRENFLNVFVLEKVYAWKTRTSFQLVDGDDKPVELSLAEATVIQSRLLANEDFFGESLRRLEVSRLLPSKCPLILAIAAEQAKVANAAPKYTLQAGPREELLLIKWRGRSHMHCSWERASDLTRLDPSNNSTAKNKIRRYYQQQEALLGLDWKKVMEEERRVAATIQAHGIATADDDNGEANDGFFSPQCLEVERIMFCDESEMNMQVLAKQRGLNLLKYRALVQEMEDASADVDDIETVNASACVELDKATLNIRKAACNVLDIASKDAPWDPEDNVRYVVKWKGLPYSEMTWEYWRDIKRDAVDEAEDFWHRQRAPNVDEAIEAAMRPHPNIRDFRKLDGSINYGKSMRARPIIGLDGAPIVVNDDDEEAVPRFQLRSYQLEGVNWLLFNWWNRRSCILADEMGLGKTIQSAAFLQELQTTPGARVRGPFLIVAPLSLIGQWESELKAWAPDLNVVFFHGSANARDFLVQHEFYYAEPFVSKQEAASLKKSGITKFHVLITTYEVVLKDITVLSKLKWRTLIVDEAHRLKNSKAKLFEELASVPRDYCVLLTGTPIGNCVDELYALLHFANPTIFDDEDDFLQKFGQMTDAKQVNALHSLLKPYLLRRVKEDVEKSLPPKEETILEVSLTPIQKTFYKAIYERNTAFLYKGAKPNNAPSLMNVMMELRKCCNHPYLVKGAEDRIVSEAAAKLSEKEDERGHAIEYDQGKLFGEQLVKSSGKMVLLEKLLHKLFADGHKVLIFSQMVRVLDLIEELLKMKSYRYERLDGSTSSSSRTHAVDRFNRNSLKRFVMLLSTRAGGLGLNLTAADIVIIYDSDWNPQNDLQAMARAHRIGQTKAVQVFRLLTAKTYEMHMFHSASMKLGLERAVLSQNREQGVGDDSDADNKSRKKADREQQAKEIDELLKKGAYDVFRGDEDDREAEKFMETDIDQLLAHSSKKVVYGDATSSSLGSGLGSFSKASFVASTDEGEKDVDLDDPDFWSKAIGLEVPLETPEDIAQMIDDGVKRSRKQVQVYDPYAEVAEAEQMRKDRLALERLMEREEKERIRLEKKQKIQEVKAKKKLEQEQQSVKLLDNKGGAKVPTLSREVVKMNKTPSENLDLLLKPKKTKKSERHLSLKRAENEDPLMERLKQGWEVPQRAKATAAFLRFGFGRFCKMRSESNLSSLPLQDLENFVRCYVFQLGLQAAQMLITKLPGGPNFVHLRALFQEWLGGLSVSEVDWLTESIRDVIIMQADVESYRRMLRMPAILVEPVYVDLLRNGGALRALRRIGLLTRLNQFIEDCIDSVLSQLGHEELGKRGCASHDLINLDVDLKARYISTEELSLAISTNLSLIRVREPVSWWDRSCDIGLLIGSFVHGLGNYESMRNDSELPFAQKLRKLVHEDEACKEAMDCFRTAAAAARQTFDGALESARIKAELEVQAAVAAAAKAASQREVDAARLRKGGAEAELAAKNMPDTQVENAFAYDGTDSHFVTLLRMQSDLLDAIGKHAALVPVNMESESESHIIKGSADGDDSVDGASSERIKDHQRCPIPDARILDHRLLLILRTIEVSMNAESFLEEPNPDLWLKSDDCLTNILVSKEIIPLFVTNKDDIFDEFCGIGIGANQCGTSHRTLNDGCDYGFGSASQQLSQVAYGTDAPRYLRALGVPMNITRFAISGLVYADTTVVKRLVDDEHLRYFGSSTDLTEVFDMPSLPMAPASFDEAHIDTMNITDGGAVEDAFFTAASVSADLLAIDQVESELIVKSNSDVETTEEQKARELATMAKITDSIPSEFRFNSKLRATVCLATLFYGFPATNDSQAVGTDIWVGHVSQLSSSELIQPPMIFSVSDFRNVVIKLAPDIDVPDSDLLRQYIALFLLPHCLRLCINGNGPTTRGARGSEGKYETAYGISLHPEPNAHYPSPLPDPCMSLQGHSMEALGYANAILRRVRLLRACQYIVCGDGVVLDNLNHVVRSKPLLALKDMPVWWRPSVHDVGLVIQAATCGLFSVIPDRESHELFSRASAVKYLQSIMVERELASTVARHSTTEQLSLWTRKQAQKFPSLYQQERRLAFVCSRVTVGCSDGNRFDCIPMFDHGGWPRN